MSGLTWGVGLAINLGAVGGLVAWASRDATTATQRAALLGVATGASFGLTAALIKAMTEAVAHHGLAAIFTTWQTYAMVLAGALAMFLLQSALNAGPLVAAQPGFTAADPVVSILWGTAAFGETVRGGVYLILAVGSAVVVGWGVFMLSRSPVVSDNSAETDPAAVG